MARDAPDSLSLSVWWTVTGWPVCICQILSVCICFTIFVWIYLQISPQLAGWCKRDGFRNIAEAIASFAKWIVPLFQNCINTSFKSNTNFRENICFFYNGATDIVLFCGWDREVPIQRSLTQFWQFMGSTSWTGSGKDMKTKSTKEKCKSRKESVEDLSGKRLLNHNALCGVKELVSFASLWCEMYLEHSYLNQFWPPSPSLAPNAQNIPTAIILRLSSQNLYWISHLCSRAIFWKCSQKCWKH